jgi:arylsulfatase
MGKRFRLLGRSSPWFAAGLGVLLAGLTGCEPQSPTTPPAEPPPEPGPAPNIVFVLIDTLRADVMGCYGYRGGGTPNLDRIAADGVAFDRMIAQAPWTQPSMASLFCSRYPGVHKVLDYAQAFRATFEGQEKVVVFDESFDTLAESLQARGYATAAFVANPYILAEYGFAQGFDHFDSSFAKNTTPGGVVNDAAVAWLEQRDPQKPFFVFLHYMDPHGPYDAAEEFLTPLLDAVERMPNKRRLSEAEFERLKYLRKLPQVYLQNTERHNRLYPYREYWVARYEAGVRQADRFVGDLRARLQEMGLWDEAYVVVTADHGEALCEHGLWEHGWSVHHTDLQVPLILHWAGVLPAGKRVRHTLRLIDLMPTILDQLRLPQPAGLQGFSLVDHIAGRPPSKPVVAFAEGVKLGAEQKALYAGDWKLMVTPSTGRRQLYNIADDPLEQNDLAASNGATLGSLIRVLQEQVALNARIAGGFVPGTAELTQEQYDRLKALGYIR